MADIKSEKGSIKLNFRTDIRKLDNVKKDIKKDVKKDIKKDAIIKNDKKDDKSDSILYIGYEKRPKPNPNNIIKKVSAGIALFRNVNNETEIVFVKKRYTYMFSLFVLGAYDSHDTKRLLYMFSRMIIEEKIMILKLDFDLLWNHLWMLDVNNPKFQKKKIGNVEFYKKKRNKFEQLINDGGKYIRKIVAESKNSPLVWEIPKGRIFESENLVECAVREFEEETGIKKKSYTLLADVKPIVMTYRDGNFHYKYYYYLARSNETEENLKRDPSIKINLRIDFNNIDQISELVDIKWLTLDQIKLLNSSCYKFHEKVFKWGCTPHPR